MTWLRPDEVAAELGITVQHARVLAHRRGWRKAGKGRQIGYWIDDVAKEEARRLEGARKTLDNGVM